MEQISWTTIRYRSDFWPLRCHVICHACVCGRRGESRNLTFFRLESLEKGKPPPFYSGCVAKEADVVSDCTTQRLRACVRPSLWATWSQNNTHTAIKDDNSAVQTGNFGHRSAILLAFIGSYQWRLNCINTEEWTQSVSQESHIKDHWGKLIHFYQAGWSLAAREL